MAQADLMEPLMASNIARAPALPCQSGETHAGPSRFILRLACIGFVALALGGCLKRGGPEVTGSIGQLAAGQSVDLEALGKRYDADPGNAAVSVAYGRALRGRDQHAQAVAVLESAAMRNPRNTEVLAAYGKALIDVGRFKQAQEVLARAHAPERPDWRILSAQGTAADQLGEHARAQQFYDAALKIAPGEAGVMSNLGLSLALSKRLPEAEKVLRQAAQSPGADERVRQNLALVLGLQGKLQEAESLMKRDLPVQEAQSNVTFLRKTVSQNNSWDQMRALDRKAKPGTRAAAVEPSATD
jgi:Flp pilus assembly protein TadD